MMELPSRAEGSVRYLYGYLYGSYSFGSNIIDCVTIVSDFMKL